MCKQKVIYLSGGIAGLPASEVEKDFIERTRKLESLGLQVLSPIRKKALDGDVEHRYDHQEIVIRDMDDIKYSQLMIAVPSEKSIGTYMEVFAASYVFHIPVIVVATAPSITSHFWIKHFAAKIVPTFDEAIEYLINWYL